jgi:hypothetical protein
MIKAGHVLQNKIYSLLRFTEYNKKAYNKGKRKIGVKKMNYWVIGGAIFFVILISIQYSLNKMIVLVKEIKEILYRLDMKDRIK